MIMPTKPSIEPTDRSMLRVTMTSTMPVAMMATDGGLDREVPEIARRQEDAAGQDVEPDPDDRQRAEHAEHAGVDLQPRQKRAFGRGGRDRVTFGRVGAGHGVTSCGQAFRR